MRGAIVEEEEVAAAAMAVFIQSQKRVVYTTVGMKAFLLV